MINIDHNSNYFEFIHACTRLGWGRNADKVPERQKALKAITVINASYASFNLRQRDHMISILDDIIAQETPPDEIKEISKKVDSLQSAIRPNLFPSLITEAENLRCSLVNLYSSHPHKLELDLADIKDDNDPDVRRILRKNLNQAIQDGNLPIIIRLIPYMADRNHIHSFISGGFHLNNPALFAALIDNFRQSSDPIIIWAIFNFWLTFKIDHKSLIPDSLFANWNPVQELLSNPTWQDVFAHLLQTNNPKRIQRMLACWRTVKNEHGDMIPNSFLADWNPVNKLLSDSLWQDALIAYDLDFLIREKNNLQPLLEFCYSDTPLERNNEFHPFMAKILSIADPTLIKKLIESTLENKAGTVSSCLVDKTLKDPTWATIVTEDQLLFSAFVDRLITHNWITFQRGFLFVHIIYEGVALWDAMTAEQVYQTVDLISKYGNLPPIKDMQKLIKKLQGFPEYLNAILLGGNRYDITLYHRALVYRNIAFVMFLKEIYPDLYLFHMIFAGVQPPIRYAVGIRRYEVAYALIPQLKPSHEKLIRNPIENANSIADLFIDALTKEPDQWQEILLRTAFFNEPQVSQLVLNFLVPTIKGLLNDDQSLADLNRLFPELLIWIFITGEKVPTLLESIPQEIVEYFKEKSQYVFKLLMNGYYLFKRDNKEDLLSDKKILENIYTKLDFLDAPQLEDSNLARTHPLQIFLQDLHAEKKQLKGIIQNLEERIERFNA